MHMLLDAVTQPETGCSFCPGTPVRPATVVVEYRLPEPFSPGGESEPLYLLVCSSWRCTDLADQQAERDGAPERLVDVYPLTPEVAGQVLGSDGLIGRAA